MIDILTSRKFIAAFVGILAVVAEGLGRSFNTEELIGLLVVVVSYIIAVAVNPGIDGGKLAETLKSRRFWAAVVGILVMGVGVVGLKLPLSPDNMIEIAVVLGGYIVSVGVEQKLLKDTE